MRESMLIGTRWSLFLLAVVSLFLSGFVLAETPATANAERSSDQKSDPRKSKITSLFGKSFNTNGFFSDSEEDVAEVKAKVEATPTPSATAAEAKVEAPAQNGAAPAAQGNVVPVSAPEAPSSDSKKPVFVSSDPSSHILPPDQNAKVRINPEAPGPFIAMADAFQRGDDVEAKAYARQFVRYLVDLMFQVKAITNLIGEAMVEEGTIEEDSWVGVEQYLDVELAEARSAVNSQVRPTHEEALKRIKADVKGEAEIYYFFSLSSSYARKMAPDVERLWQIAKKDPSLKMVALSLSPESNEYVSAYRRYTGLTAPIMTGTELAKTFRVAFVPTLVVVAPNGGAAYMKTGQQDFRRMYEFVRTVQGKGIAFTPDAEKLVLTKIGNAEKNGLATASPANAPTGANDQGLARAQLKRGLASGKSSPDLKGVVVEDPREKSKSSQLTVGKF